MNLASAIYEGSVRHRRTAPVEHAFAYRLFMLYLDLDELRAVFRLSRWWRQETPAPASFRRRDYLAGGPSLADSVRDLVAVRTGRRPAGPIRMLTHLRYFGLCFNPVTFYYCFAADGRQVEAIVAEITNTPWRERHAYVVGGEGGALRKAFHISPFMGMDQDYDWRFTAPGEALAVHMENREAGQRIFTATLDLERRPLTGPALDRLLIRYPLITVKVLAGIYLQAARLWWKQAPFHPHPAIRSSDTPRATAPTVDQGCTP